MSFNAVPAAWPVRWTACDGLPVRAIRYVFSVSDSSCPFASSRTPIDSSVHGVSALLVGPASGFRPPVDGGRVRPVVALEIAFGRRSHRPSSRFGERPRGKPLPGRVGYFAAFRGHRGPPRGVGNYPPRRTGRCRRPARRGCRRGAPCWRSSCTRKAPSANRRRPDGRSIGSTPGSAGPRTGPRSNRPGSAARSPPRRGRSGSR
jgi:hypothetical protein